MTHDVKLGMAVPRLIGTRISPLVTDVIQLPYVVLIYDHNFSFAPDNEWCSTVD